MSSNLWGIAALSKQHDRSSFNCGVTEMDRFLREHANQNAKNDFSRTFVAVPADNPACIGGYYTITLRHMTFEELPKELGIPSNGRVPISHLGRLAVDVNFQRKGLGEILLYHFLYRSQRIADSGGCYAVELVAIDERAAQFYSKYGFNAVDNRTPLHLYKTMKEIRKMDLEKLMGHFF